RSDLPVDATVEIISRVPARSIHRFKCVSRAWRDLIADPLYRKQLPQTIEGFFCSDACGTLGYIVCNPATEQCVAVPSTGYLEDRTGDQRGVNRSL
ncbi:hypothetical protein BAE44_0019783, partial [Dichanthelium oligosanthes]